MSIFSFIKIELNLSFFLKNRPIKAYFILAAIWDVGGRFSHFTQDQPLNIFWTDYFELQQTPYNRVSPGDWIGASGDWFQQLDF